MQKVGILSEDENFELIEGEIVPMQAKTHIHELMKSTLSMSIARVLPEPLWLAVATSIYLSPNTFVEIDLVVYPKGLKLESVRGSDIVLAIKVATKSLAYDRALKAQLYARHDVREFWVIDAERRSTFVHFGPRGQNWSNLIERGPEDTLACAALPGFSLRLGDV